jgi:hypothetical protein
MIADEAIMLQLTKVRPSVTGWHIAHLLAVVVSNTTAGLIRV